MPPFSTLTIRPRGAHYEVIQHDDVLLRVPRPVFESYDAHDVFPPAWSPHTPSHPIRRLFWNPNTREFLLAGLEAHPARTVESFGSTPLRSFLQGLWSPTSGELLTRPFWHPKHPLDDFAGHHAQVSLSTQLEFSNLLGRLRPPAGWTHVLNAGQAYLDQIGLGEVDRTEPGKPTEEVCLVVAPGVEAGSGLAALREIGITHARRLSPVLRGGRLVAVHALRRTDRHEAERILDALDLDHTVGPCRRH